MITVIGLGFVGLTTALGFSHKGYKVFGFDTNEGRTSLVESGKVPFFEPELEEVLKDNINKNFFVAKELDHAVNHSKFIFFCVGTPSKKDGSSDLSYLLKAIENALGKIEKKASKILVIKSTTPPSSTLGIVKPFIENLGFEVGKDIGLTNNPEFLREGSAWEDFTKPDRVVIGECDEASGRAVEELYKSFNAPIFRVSANTAEFVKYLSNTFLSTVISFSNEMSMIANIVGDVDIKNSFEILHHDKRWGGTPAGMASYVYPGCGFGGYCLPKDTQAMYSHALSIGYSPSILKGVLDVNVKIKRFVVDTISGKAGKEKRIGILGLSFKPNSDDVRDTPSADIIKMLIEEGYSKITVYDPLAAENFKLEYKLPVEYADSMESAVNKSDCIVILTAWDEFKTKNGLLAGKDILDFRYIL